MDFDLNLLRSAVTVLALACFLGIVRWALARGNHERFEEAARLPLADDGSVQ